MMEVSLEDKRRIKTIVGNRIVSSSLKGDDEIKTVIEDVIIENLSDLPLCEIKSLASSIYVNLRTKLGPLTPLIEDDSIDEIIVNGFDTIFIERGGKISKVPISFDTVEDLESCIRTIAASVHREFNERVPILDARLEDGSRVNAIYKNIALKGPTLNIRKFSTETITMDKLVSLGSVTSECRDFLKTIVRSGYNIFVSGGTSTGKTTFLNALAEYIPIDNRVVVIEDSSELQIKVPDIVQLECRNGNSSGSGSITLDMLIKTSLRMRPDLIVIGEVRGSEVATMLQGLNTGHSGMSTGHGNSIRGMLRRMEAMYLMGSDIPIDAIRTQIVEAIDIMIHLGRLGNGKRMVLEIGELIDYRDGGYVINDLFRTDICDGKPVLQATGNVLQNSVKVLLNEE